MEEIKLKAQLREEIGKQAVRKLRNKGLVPAVVYRGAKAEHLTISAKDFQHVIHTKAGENVIIHLDIEGGKPEAKSKKALRPTIIKEIQYHPVKGNILHVDLNEISLTEVITVKVPVVTKGEAKGVKEGGVLEHVLWEVEVECLPTQIPENISVDVTELQIGDTIMLKGLRAPEGVKLLGDPDAAVLAVAAPYVEKPAEAPLEGEEMKEPEVIMERKPKEEEAAEDASGKQPAKDKEKDKEK
ncbi:MAG: 50S ribosomal protein L25 [Candidatus Omnitrophota bacterium]